MRGAISGFGEVAARAHLAGWLTRPDVCIVAVHDPVAARRHQAINLVRNVHVYDDLDLMLDGERLDFLDVASPPGFHAAAARKALEAGANVLVEKPLCLEAVEFAELATLAQRNSRVLMCVHNPCEHYWADIIADKDLLRAGRARQARRAGMPAVLDDEALHLHAQPLLAAWGKQGRDFIGLLDEHDASEAREHYAPRFMALRQRIDLFASHGDDCLLHQLQDDIRDL